MLMLPKRAKRLQSVVQKRQSNLTIVLENVHDPHNIGAVLRSCDSVGIMEIFVLYTEPDLQEDRLYLSKKTASGAQKWIDINYYTDLEACFKHVKSKYENIWSTHLSEDAVGLHELDLTESVALLFGNEHGGVSKEALSHSNGNFIIPQAGMVQSLNISVACAVTLYEAFRQRDVKKMYDENCPLSTEEQAALFEDYAERHVMRVKKRWVDKMG